MPESSMNPDCDFASIKSIGRRLTQVASLRGHQRLLNEGVAIVVRGTCRVGS